MSPIDVPENGGRGVRSLVTEILGAQLIITGIIGICALAGLVWMSNAVVNNSLARWAEQWTGELDELGAPLYLSDAADAVLGVERFIAKYPELIRVTWYRPGGDVIMSLGETGLELTPPGPLADHVIAELTAKAGAEVPFLLTEDTGSRRQFRFSGPVWTESVVGGDLLGPDPVGAETLVELLGFVSADLDYSAYQAALAPRLAVASAVLVALLVLSWAAGRMLLKRALWPLSALQQPLAELAEGRRDLVLPRSPHGEIQNIVQALDDTIEALDRREQRLLHLATHDPLTGLYSRRFFIDVLQEEIEACNSKGRSSALLFIDLDQFKYVNDTSGHLVGDEMLKAAGQQIRHAVRMGDVVARFGGDEFVALIRGVTRAESRTVATQVLELMRSLTHVADDQVFHMQCSIGVAVIGSGRYSAQELLAQADIACRTAKAHGRNRAEIYNVSSKQSEQIERDVHWMREIRRALEHDAFELHYQPLMHIPTRSVTHYEALLRLRGEMGLVKPDRFLPAAVRFGLMTDIDRWVLMRAIRVLADNAAGAADLRLSVNLTADTFDVPNISGVVRTLLAEHGVAGDRLVFEITEQLAVRFAASTDKQFAALRDLGCRFAIDDFGTGYSSFSYLKQLPVDYLKIDGSFIRQLARDRVDQATVRMMSEVASVAGIETVAEYVQTAAAFERLVEYGIDYAQGRYIGDAVPEFRQGPIDLGDRREARS